MKEARVKHIHESKWQQVCVSLTLTYERDKQKPDLERATQSEAPPRFFYFNWVGLDCDWLRSPDSPANSRKEGWDQAPRPAECIAQHITTWLRPFITFTWGESYSYICEGLSIGVLDVFVIWCFVGPLWDVCNTPVIFQSRKCVNGSPSSVNVGATAGLFHQGGFIS